MRPSSSVIDGSLSRTRDARGSGFTLLELMLSVGLASLVILLVLALAYTVSRAVNERQVRRTGPVAMLRAMDQMTRDLMNHFPAAGYDQGGFTLENDPPLRGHAVSRLTFCSATAAPVDTDPRWFELTQVAYFLELEPREPGRLVRTRQPLVGPGALQSPARDVLAEGIDGLEVEILRGDEWTGEWTGKPAESGPSAARITLHPASGKTYTIEILIPSGLEIQPTPDKQD
jgi:type II secretory pathway component PulJ